MRMFETDMSIFGLGATIPGKRKQLNTERKGKEQIKRDRKKKKVVRIHYMAENRNALLKLFLLI